MLARPSDVLFTFSIFQAEIMNHGDAEDLVLATLQLANMILQFKEEDLPRMQVKVNAVCWDTNFIELH